LCKFHCGKETIKIRGFDIDDSSTAAVTTTMMMTDDDGDDYIGVFY
jgi:hypothetical protein